LGVVLTVQAPGPAAEVSVAGCRKALATTITIPTATIKITARASILTPERKDAFLKIGSLKRTFKGILLTSQNKVQQYSRNSYYGWLQVINGSFNHIVAPL
jgi:hypothetical protein